MSEEDKKIEEENKEVETTQESVSDEAMSNIKDSSTWIDALLVVVYLMVISYSIFLLWIIAFAQFIFKLITKKPNKNLGDLTNVFQKFINQIIDFVTFETEEIAEKAVKQSGKDFLGRTAVIDWE